MIFFYVGHFETFWDTPGPPASRSRPRVFFPGMTKPAISCHFDRPARGLIFFLMRQNATFRDIGAAAQSRHAAT